MITATGSIYFIGFLFIIIQIPDLDEVVILYRESLSVNMHDLLLIDKYFSMENSKLGTFC